jgi:hypothetical protein
MSDSYRAIFDAAFQQLDISFAKSLLQEQIAAVGFEHSRPSAVFRPALSIDGDQWCALYGDDLQNGVAGFGRSPVEAMTDFDNAWHRKLESRNV